MEQKPYEIMAEELARAKDTLLNEVAHRQQLGQQLQGAAKHLENFQSMARKDLSDIRQLACEGKIAEIIAIVDRAIGQEPKEPVAPVTGEPKAAK